MTTHPEFPQNYKNIHCCNQHIDYVKYTQKHHHISLLGGSNDNLSCNDTNPRYNTAIERKIVDCIIVEIKI